jgi:hypothetical protein
MLDLLSNEDLRLVKSFVQNAELFGAKVKAARAGTQKHVDDAFKSHFPKTTYNQKKSEYKQATSFRWVAQVRVTDNVDTVCRKLAPPGISILRRSDIGQFYVCQKRRQLGWFSWTRLRNVNEALEDAAYAAWQKYEDDFGLTIPATVQAGIDAIKSMDLRV